MRTKILKLLRDTKEYVSGQELCEKFGVSRTAVWKAVGQLKKEGYGIEAVQNKGYRLVSVPDVLSREEIISCMKTKRMGRNVVYLERTGSTNQDAKRLAEEGAQDGTLVVTDCQETGKGRRGRGWVSPPGINIYFTLLLRPQFQPDKASMLTLVMALSVAQAIERRTGYTPGIKWPNDIVMDGKKVCGILTEMTLEEEYIQSVVIGVGINVGQTDFPEEIKDKATSLALKCGTGTARSSLIAGIMERFEKNYALFEKNLDLSYLKDTYETYLVNKNREVRILDPAGEYEGRAEGINEKGELLIELPDGSVRRVYAGEVSVRGLYGYV